MIASLRGTVQAVRYFPGRFLNARHRDCARVNEQLWVDLIDDDGRHLRVKQISGALARRLVCWLAIGERVVPGDRYGMIKYGSRADVLVTPGADVAVAVTGATESALRCVVDAFRADGVSFLKPYGHEALRAEELIDISHEALIRCWRRIAEPREGWLAREFRNGLVWRALLVQADSFERDPGNVLGATTTDERERWLRRRNAIWAERYGGGWERVQRLIAASVEARALRAAEREAAETQRQEARRLRRRSRALAIGIGVLAFTSALGGLAWQQSRIAEDARRVAEGERELALTARDEVVRQLEALVEAREAEATARAAAEAVAQEARQSATALASVVDELERATTAANAPASGDGQAVHAVAHVHVERANDTDVGHDCRPIRSTASRTRSQ